MNYIPSLSLNNNCTIPCIGIGPGTVKNCKIKFPQSNVVFVFINKVIGRCYFIIQSHKYVRNLSSAIRMGYRLIDYSTSYGNENLVGKAIRKSGVPRDQIFITSRISNPQQYRGVDVRTALNNTLQNFGINYIDLYMFHWPVPEHFIDTYKQMEDLYKEGKIKSLGVANCNIHHLEELLAKCSVVPAINQIEVHPLFTQKSLLEFCKSKGIRVEAYTPLARNDDRLFRSNKLKLIATKYNKSVAQIILRWDFQNGVVTIPRSSNPQRQLQNISIFDFELTVEEMKIIDSMNINSRLRYDPDNCEMERL